MPLYEVTVEVDGVVHVEVEATDEDDACRKARKHAELGMGTHNVDYEAVACKPVAR